MADFLNKLKTDSTFRKSMGLSAVRIIACAALALGDVFVAGMLLIVAEVIRLTKEI